MHSDFSVLLGPDGIGKSTVLGLLLQNVTLVNWKQWAYILSKNPACPEDYDDIGLVVNQWSPEVRCLSLTLMLQLMYHQGIVPHLGGDLPILVDSYYYRFWAKLKVLGTGTPSFFETLLGLPPPKQAFVFENFPELAWERKGGSLQRYEYQNSPSLPDFFKFQTEVHNLYMELLEKQGVEIVMLDPSSEPVTIAEKIQQYL
jgi:thymidylate kinase